MRSRPRIIATDSHIRCMRLWSPLTRLGFLECSRFRAVEVDLTRIVLIIITIIFSITIKLAWVLVAHTCMLLVGGSCHWDSPESALLVGTNNGIAVKLPCSRAGILCPCRLISGLRTVLWRCLGGLEVWNIGWISFGLVL